MGNEEYQKKDLKRGVDYIGVNCVFWCHDGAGKVLMHKRSARCRDEQGTWDCGGGSMEFGETFEETVRREVLEEYGVEPITIEYITTRNVLREHNGEMTHWIKNLHWVRVDPAIAKNAEPEKIEEIGWFAFDNLPEPLHSQIGLEVDILKEFLSSRMTTK
ncbi:MAG: NUDIX domain-containing protein [Candidatus Taylorbacteria bacterium]|nr:NUDIX domain-containing protein [Candidatus Taylorbacteria bacterium]